MVSQCCSNILSMFTRTGLRTSLQLATDLVSRSIHSSFDSTLGSDVHSAELEMTVNMLIQIDKLVQLLESPVFTCRSQ